MKEAFRTDLADKVRFLGDPHSYGLATGLVEARETHLSWVFLAGDRVYKLKKPVRRPFLDFRTIRSRAFYCREEVRLNRRLTRDIYLGTVPLCRLPGGGFRLGGGGRVADWLVEMRRLPQSMMMDAAAAEARVGEKAVRAVADLLAGFYAANRVPPRDGPAYLAHLLEEQRVNRHMLLRRDIGLPERARPLLDAVDALLHAARPEIEARIAAGAMVEGHGDLRPEHVCLLDPPQIFDCLEFSRAMRILDPYDEVNFLGLECEVLGAGWVRPLLLAHLEREIGNVPSRRLLSLYSAFRALLRARLCIVHYLDKPVRKPEKWRPFAIRYLEQAESALSMPPPPGDPRSSRSG